MLTFFFSSRRRHTRCSRDWSSDVCSSDLAVGDEAGDRGAAGLVGGEGLAEEDPEGDERGEHPVPPPADGGQRVGDDVLGEDRSEERRVGKECSTRGAAMY